MSIFGILFDSVDAKRADDLECISMQVLSYSPLRCSPPVWSGRIDLGRLCEETPSEPLAMEA